MTHPIKSLRKALDLTQAEVAEVGQVTVGRISQVEGDVEERLGIDATLLVWERWRSDFARLGYSLEDVLRGTRTKAA